MLHKTRGIILSNQKYSESSVILKVYTDVFGVQSYILNSVRKNKPKHKPALLEPISFVNLVVYHKSNVQIHRIKEIELLYNYKTVPFELKKSSIMIFLKEVLSKSIHEDVGNAELFDFIFKAFVYLDENLRGMSSFHLLFMIKLSAFLGFFPNSNYNKTNCYFNIKEGMYQAELPPAQYAMDRNASYFFSKLLHFDFENLKELNLTKEMKSLLLHKIIAYYSYHLPYFKDIKSHEILENIFN